MGRLLEDPLLALTRLSLVEHLSMRTPLVRFDARVNRRRMFKQGRVLPRSERPPPFLVDRRLRTRRSNGHCQRKNSKCDS